MKWLCLKKDVGTAHSDFQNVAPIRLLLIKASGHFGCRLTTIPVDRYAFRIPPLLIPNIFCHVHHATSIFIIESIFRGRRPGIIRRGRTCVDCSAHCFLKAYGRLLHANGASFCSFEIDLVELCRTTISLDITTAEAWEALVQDLVFGGFHKSIEIACDIPISCISRVFVDFIVSRGSTLTPRQFVCYEKGWIPHIRAVTGYMSFEKRRQMGYMLKDVVDEFAEISRHAFSTGDQKTKLTFVGLEEINSSFDTNELCRNDPSLPRDRGRGECPVTLHAPCDRSGVPWFHCPRACDF